MYYNILYTRRLLDCSHGLFKCSKAFWFSPERSSSFRSSDGNRPASRPHPHQMVSMVSTEVQGHVFTNLKLDRFTLNCSNWVYLFSLSNNKVKNWTYVDEFTLNHSGLPFLICRPPTWAVPLEPLKLITTFAKHNFSGFHVQSVWAGSHWITQVWGSEGSECLPSTTLVDFMFSQCELVHTESLKFGVRSVCQAQL